MKKLLFLLVIVVLGLGFNNNVYATKGLKPTSMITPAGGSTVHASPGFGTLFTFVVTNTGDEIIGASDTILVAWGSVNGTQIAIHTPVNMLAVPHKVLNPGDTFKYAYSFTFPTSGTYNMAFLASYTAIISKFQAFTVSFNIMVGIEDYAATFNKIWYSNASVNYEMMAKSSFDATLSIYNLNGQVFKSQNLNFLAGRTYNESISTGYLPRGIYVYCLQTPYGTETKKFVVQ
jgi:hypothetical protein